MLAVAVAVGRPEELGVPGGCGRGAALIRISVMRRAPALPGRGEKRACKGARTRRLSKQIPARVELAEERFVVMPCARRHSPGDPWLAGARRQSPRPCLLGAGILRPQEPGHRLLPSITSIHSGAEAGRPYPVVLLKPLWVMWWQGVS